MNSASEQRRAKPLRRTLVIGIIVLITVITTAVGTFSTIALRNDLIERVDNHLTSATKRSSDKFAPDGGPRGDMPPQSTQPAADGSSSTAQSADTPPPGKAVLEMPGQREGTIAGLAEDGTLVSAQVINTQGEVQTLTDAQLKELGASLQEDVPTTVNISGLGSYRAILHTMDAPAAAPETESNTDTGAGTSTSTGTGTSTSTSTSTNGGSAALVMALPLADTNATVLQLILLIGAAGLAGVIITAVAGTIFVRTALRPLDRIAATATEVARVPLHQGEVALPMRAASNDAQPGSEVGQVGQALNILLDHVATALAARQESEEKLRQFVADASHELRTPLASIRAYAELSSRAPEPLPAPAQRTIQRIESESIRMSKIVEDLLLLARLDEGSELLTEQVELNQLVSDALSDASVAGPDHEWHIDIPSEAITVVGDGMRLHQVVLNLLSNARVHTPAGTAVTAALRQEENTAVIEVRDTGPGIDEAVLPTVFERFARGDGSRARSTGGTGLGLAIAAAIAHAHNGEITVTSTPGDTVFQLRLPVN